MAKQTHEIRDPLHTFIRVNRRERDQVVDSRPVQRLRQIHQLALTYLVYPGATHRRFEHSLGVMELADRVFQVIADPEHEVSGLTGEVRDFFFGSTNDQRTERETWRRVVRMAALCHDIGHFPLSHAGESLGPVDPNHASASGSDEAVKRWGHERYTLNLIRSDHLKPSLDEFAPNGAERTARLAVGQKEFVEANGLPADLSTIEAILSEIIVGDAFGVDRMDYLLRDSLHAGVAYGHFDHFRLIDTLRILPKPPEDRTSDEEPLSEPMLGIDEGGLQSAEQLLLARHFMYSQVYFHPVRRAFDIHLRDFLSGWLEGGTFPLEIEGHLRLDDARVLAAMTDAARGDLSTISDEARDAATRIVDRHHFKVAWRRNNTDIEQNVDAARLIHDALRDSGDFDPTLIKLDSYRKAGSRDRKDRKDDFPVLQSDDSTVWASAISAVVNNLPSVAIEYVFVAPEIRDRVRTWLAKHKQDILSQTPKEEEK